MEQQVRETIQFLTNVKDVPEKLFVEGCWSVLSTPFIAEFLVYLHFSVVILLLPLFATIIITQMITQMFNCYHLSQHFTAKDTFLF